MKIKRLFSILLVCAVLLSLCGCLFGASKEGVITALSGSTLTIETDKGARTFTLDGATLDLPYGPLAGRKVTVEYEGILRKNNAAAAVSVADSDLQTPPAAQTLAGTVSAFSQDLLTIQAASGSFSFCLAQADLELYTGLTVGKAVTAEYYGDLAGGADTVRLVRLTDDAPAAATFGAVPVSLANDVVWATDDLNAMAGPGLDAGRICVVPAGTRLRRTGSAGGGWSQVIYDEQFVYVWNDFLTQSEPSAAEHTPSPYTCSRLDVAFTALADGAVRVSADGKEASFSAGGPALRFAQGFRPGQTARLEFSGSFGADDMVVYALADDKGGEAELTGTVAAKSANTFTLRTPDGAECLLFVSGEAAGAFQQLAAGLSVTVTLEPHDNLYAPLFARAIQVN